MLFVHKVRDQLPREDPEAFLCCKKSCPARENIELSTAPAKALLALFLVSALMRLRGV